MAWESRTRQFGRGELALIERLSAQELVPMIVGSDPVVALRVMAEVLLNGDDPKLTALLGEAAVNARWMSYADDDGVNDSDRGYAQRLHARLGK